MMREDRVGPAPARALAMTGGGSGREGGRALKTRVKTARKRSLSSTLWLERQLNDPYCRPSPARGLSLALGLQLLEIADKHKLFKPGQRIVDLGAAPGGWSQVAAAPARAKDGAGRVIAIDLIEMDPVEGVEFRRMDFHDPDAPTGILREWLGGPSRRGPVRHGGQRDGPSQDQSSARRRARRACCRLRPLEVLALGGFFVAKVLQGGAEGELLARLKREFATVRHLKPKASRADSANSPVLRRRGRGAFRLVASSSSDFFWRWRLVGVRQRQRNGISSAQMGEAGEILASLSS